MRHVFATMGTVASIDLPKRYAHLREQIEAVFRRVDERFSLYRRDSELSRINRGELALTAAGPALLASYERCIAWRNATGALFSVHRPDGVIDLNGIVKAEAIELAGGLLDAAGCPEWSINVGGDILVRGDRWATGLADPSDAGALLGSVGLGGELRALATSGSAQRGDHIWRGGELGALELVQVSVMAADIVTADVLATAIVAGGPDALDTLAERFAIHVLAIDRAGALSATPGFRAALGLSLA